MERDHKPVREH
jgi:hypothetical protein